MTRFTPMVLGKRDTMRNRTVNMSRRAWEIVVYVMITPLFIFVGGLLIASVVLEPLWALAIFYLVFLLYAMGKSW